MSNETTQKATQQAPGDVGRFDAILQQLTTIVERLESDELDLEASLAAFEQGISLSRRGQQILDTAEERVEILLRDGRTEPMKTE
jgi:exodeoxyribonuclease VII small subunit